MVVVIHAVLQFYFRKMCTETFWKIRRSIDGQYVMCKMNINGYSYIFANIYAPNTDSPEFLGGLSLHLNHLIGSGVGNYDWQFGTLPFGIFGSNLDTMGLETYPRTYSGQF